MNLLFDVLSEMVRILEAHELRLFGHDVALLLAAFAIVLVWRHARR